MSKRQLTFEEGVMLEMKRYRRALLALDALMDFSSPDQVYVFRPLDDPDATRLWKRVNTMLRPKKKS